jgi:hypothetical protein
VEVADGSTVQSVQYALVCALYVMLASFLNLFMHVHGITKTSLLFYFKSVGAITLLMCEGCLKPGVFYV